MTTPARLERERFADALLAAGPDAPTLCEGWTARDLAAHVVVRDRRPDAMPGVLIPALSGYTERVQDRIAETDWLKLVARARSGPPIWSPTRLAPVERLVNTIEFFVHHEDVRRAEPGWEARDLDRELADDLYAAVKRSARMFARKAPAGVTLEPDGHPEIVAKQDEPMVIVRGSIGELVLWLYGRQAQANVEYAGPEDAVEAVLATSFGI